MQDEPLKTPVQFVPGVGPKRARLLEKLELRTVEDLLWNMPRDVLDLSQVHDPVALHEDELQTVRGKVVDVDCRQLRGGRTLSAVLIDCGGRYVRGVWFNQVWVLKKFQSGQHVLFSGKPKRRGGRWEFGHPRVQWIEDDDPEAHSGALARYGLTEGLKMHEMRRLMHETVERYVQYVPESLPAPFRDCHDLLNIRQALTQVHRPGNLQQYEQGQRRMIFDDLLEFQLGQALRRRAWRKDESAPVLPATAKIDARIRRLFPFELTEGQDRAVREICSDLAAGRAMHRLLQADVGAGKTAVALYAMLVAVASGYQAVLMAPTEVLASQHWNTLQQALAHSRVNRLLLTGHLTRAQRREVLQQISAGDAQIVVGTQAVIQQDVQFKRLGLAVIDEQHKFGVAQRAHFSTAETHDTGDAPHRRRHDSSGADRDRGTALSPHVLVMTATPLPRSLCMTRFGDLDITTIRDMPPGRQPVVTSRATGEPQQRKGWEFVREQLRKGRQAYVICPRIEAGDASSEQASAKRVHQELNAGELRDFRVGLVHGQMDQPTKSRVMSSFREGYVQVLVSTTVVEVGIDVPNASIIVVLQAERFGLSQLHQLRGRIARGAFQGYCLLFSGAESAEAVGRLEALEKTSDGFKIAEVDFELRGPGDILGTRQHGDLPLRVADLARDQCVLAEAREAAFKLVETGEFDRPEFAPLKTRVLDRFGRLMDLAQSG